MDYSTLLLHVNSFEEFMIKMDLLGDDVDYSDLLDVIYGCYNNTEKEYIFDILSKVILTSNKLDRYIFKTYFPLQFFESDYKDTKEKQNMYVRFQIFDDIVHISLWWKYPKVIDLVTNICFKIISTYGKIPSVIHMIEKINKYQTT